MVRPEFLTNDAAYLSIRSATVDCLGTGAKPPLDIWLICASIVIDQSLASRFVAKVAAL